MALKHQVGWDPKFLQRSPWFWPLASAASAFTQLGDWPSRAQLNAMYGLLHPSSPPFCFADNVRREDKRADGRVQVEQLYDARIALRGEVPTRERDWHDFFNALCFATFPRSKRALHRRQFALLRQRIAPDATRLPPTRTPEQDALTLFDEGGALIAAEAAVSEQLRAAPQTEVGRALGAVLARGAARVVPFGHALFEHLVEGLRCPGGFSLVIPVRDVAAADAALLAELDGLVAQRLEDSGAFQSPREGGHLHLDQLLGEQP